MTLTAHKLHGPVGVGALLVQHDIQPSPGLFGGFQQGGLRPGTEPVALVKGMLHSGDANLIDEIAARVWYVLVANDGALLTRFDPSRGNRLITFMRAIARDEAKRYFRTEARRREREEAATREKAAAAIPDGPTPQVLVEEFLTTLSPADRSFCLQHVLTASPQERGQLTSQPAGWQQTHRLYKKLLAFLGREL